MWGILGWILPVLQLWIWIMLWAYVTQRLFKEMSSFASPSILPKFRSWERLLCGTLWVYIVYQIKKHMKTTKETISRKHQYTKSINWGMSQYLSECILDERERYCCWGGHKPQPMCGTLHAQYLCKVDAPNSNIGIIWKAYSWVRYADRCGSKSGWELVKKVENWLQVPSYEG